MLYGHYFELSGTSSGNQDVVYGEYSSINIANEKVNSQLALVCLRDAVEGGGGVKDLQLVVVEDIGVKEVATEDGSSHRRYVLLLGDSHGKLECAFFGDDFVKAIGGLGLIPGNQVVVKGLRVERFKEGWRGAACRNGSIDRATASKLDLETWWTAAKAEDITSLTPSRSFRRENAPAVNTQELISVWSWIR